MSVSDNISVSLNVSVSLSVTVSVCVCDCFSGNVSASGSVLGSWDDIGTP